MTFRELLAGDEIIILDGAMGTMLQKNGLELGGLPEELNFTNPELIEKIHREYVEAGAQAVYANTFGANRHKLRDSRYSVEQVVKKGIEIARKAAGDKALVALDVGSLGRMMRPTGDLPVEEAYDMFREIVTAGKDADFIVLETMTDLMEIKTALLAAKENTDLPVVCTMSFENNMRTFTGCTVASMALTLTGLGADVIGMNCSLGPDDAIPIAGEILRYADGTPVIIRPNAGLPDPKTNLYSVTPEQYADDIEKMADMGVRVFGGCCGTTPEFIAELSRRLSGRKYVPVHFDMPSAVCSASKVVTIDTVRVIGERINPTGKKLFKEALKRHDLDYIMKQAIEQTDAGAEILDVNVGLPDIDEEEMMLAAVDVIQSVTDAPLQIDTTEPQVLEAALRNVCGKPIVNSVNGEDEKLDTVLPLVKKYGAAVIGLALDKDGIPKTAEKRFEIAEKILRRAQEYGIPKRDVFIDCLTLTASAEQDGAAETLKAMRMVREKLGLKNVLGVSNISFGLPNRELVNSTFLSMAMQSGLDLPIMNPNSMAMSGAVAAFRLLSGYDRNGSDFIERFGAQKLVTQTVSSGDSGSVKTENAGDIRSAVSAGLKAECAAAAEKLLSEGADPMDIINDMLIPALDETGEKFEKGKIFLPQLIQSAGAAQAAFDAVKKHISAHGGTNESRGKVVLATVKGDVHDIGKNIVKTLLENYGFEVIDLGKDVEYQAVVDAAIKHDVRLVGLSALMTTTLKSMEGTIKLLRENNVNCKVVVGGAVVTAEYAMKIGADFYAKDAKETVDVAKQVYGE